MMKKSWIKLMALGIVTSMVAVACSPSQDANKDMKDTETTMEKDTKMEKETDTSMDKEADTEKESMNATEATEATMEKEMPTEEVAAEGATEGAQMMTNSGDQAPAFEFVDMDGNIVNNESLKGQKVYMKYWASWCSICLAGLSEVDELFTLDKDFTVYTVVTPNANGEMSQEEFVTWFNGLEQKNIKVLFDMKGQAASEFAVRAFPTSVFIGSDGVLIQATAGHKSNDDIIKTVDSFY